jgi:hypothetical protein
VLVRFAPYGYGINRAPIKERKEEGEKEATGVLRHVP